MSHHGDAKRSLSEAMEAHDVEMLRSAISNAIAKGVSADEVGTAQRILDFEVNKDLYKEVDKVRVAVGQLAESVDQVQRQAKSFNTSSLPGDGTMRDNGVEAWMQTIVKQVEQEVWQNLEKRVEEKVGEAVATAVEEVKKWTKELSHLVDKAADPVGQKDRKTSLGLGDGKVSEDLKDGKGKGKTKKGKGKAPASNDLLSPGGLGQNGDKTDTGKRPSRLAQRPSVLNSRIGEAMGLKPQGNAPKIVEKPEEVAPVAPVKKRKPVEPATLKSIFKDDKNMESSIEKVLKGQSEDELLRGVPAFLKEPQNWGIKVKDVIAFYNKIKKDLAAYVLKEQQLGEDFNENLHVVTPRYIKPWTERFSPYGLAAVQNAKTACSNKVGSLEELFTARVFISHCWNEVFGDFISTMNSMLDPHDVVWICAISICQNVDIQSILGDSIEESPFWLAMPHCRRVAMLIDKKAEPFERAWCALEEYLATYKLRLPFSICMPDTMDEGAWHAVDKKLQDFSIRDCKASEQSDLKKILDIIADKADIVDSVVRQESTKACFAARVMKVATTGTIKDLTPLAMESLCHVTDGAGRTILHVCAQLDKRTQLKDLLDLDLIPDIKDAAGKVPLHFAAEVGLKDIGQLLLSKRANIHVTDKNKWTPLAFAAHQGHDDLIRLCCENRADVNCDDNDMFTPLMTAAAEGKHLAVRELLKFKADMEREDSCGHTALTMAAQAGKSDAAKTLILVKANIDHADSEGCTPIMYAANFGVFDIVKALAGAKADLNVKDHENFTALDFAIDGGYDHIKKFLQEAASGKLPVEKTKTPDRLSRPKEKSKPSKPAPTMF